MKKEGHDRLDDRQKKLGSDQQVTLKIPRPLYEQLKQVISGSGFHSVTEFAVYVLRDLVSHHREGRGGEVTGKTGAEVVPAVDRTVDPEVDPLSTEEIEAIRKRLASLGYL